MTRQMMWITCLQDVVVHQTHIEDSDQVWIETYAAFYAGKEYSAWVDVDSSNDMNFSVVANNERGLEHLLKRKHDSKRWFEDHFMVVR